MTCHTVGTTCHLTAHHGSFLAIRLLHSLCLSKHLLENRPTWKGKTAWTTLAYFLGRSRRVQLKDIHIHGWPFSGWGFQTKLPWLPVGTPATSSRLLSGGTIPAGSCVGHWANVSRKWLMCLMFRLLRKGKIVGLFFPSKKCNTKQLSYWDFSCLPRPLFLPSGAWYLGHSLDSAPVIQRR